MQKYQGAELQAELLTILPSTYQFLQKSCRNPCRQFYVELYNGCTSDYCRLVAALLWPGNATVLLCTIAAFAATVEYCSMTTLHVTIVRCMCKALVSELTL